MPSHQLTRAETHQRRGRVVELRRQAVTWDAIAAELDVSIPRACQIYDDALKAYPRAQVGQHRHEELEMVDYATRKLRAIIESDGEDPATGKAVSARTRIEALSALRAWREHRSKLTGVYAPTRAQVDIITRDSLTEEMQRLAAELGETGRDVIDAEEVPAHDDAAVRAIESAGSPED
jgi:hypothetical protein